MFKYVRKLINFLSGDQEESIEINQQRNQVTEKKRNQDNNSGNLNTRVLYQYPKGNFRFPLIPDEKVMERKPREERKQAFNQPKENTKPTQLEQKRKSKQKAPNYQFRSTQVPSPIYGFQERKSNEQNKKFEFPPNDQKQEALLSIGVRNEPLQEVKNNDVEIQSQFSSINDDHVVMAEELQGMNQWENEEESFEIYEKISLIQMDDLENEDESLHSAEETIEHLEEIIENKSIFQTEKTNDREQVNQTSESINRMSSAKPFVPFNVMMLKQDREKLEEKKKLNETAQTSSYHFPPLHYLDVPKIDLVTDNSWLEEQRQLLDLTLENFNVKAKVVNVTQGPSVTRFEVHPEPGVKVNKITNLTDDIKLALAAKDIRMEAPIPGKNTIGIEVPNKKSKPVFLGEIIKSAAFRNNPSPLTVALGFDISGNPIVTDLKKMPHGLIAGATGSGKSVCINAMLVSLLYKAAPHEVKLLLIDPKMVELAPYNDIPHLVSPVITDVKAATAALKWAVEEMERRYERFAHTGVRDISRYNELVKEHNEPSGEMPYLVIIIDELADLMMVAPGEVEESICRIAQKARACGIHLLLATQRPSVDVITGLIKANIPTRVAFSVSSQVDSRTIIDSSGAEKLLGKGDMLFLENGSSKSVRLQGNFVSDSEIEQIVAYAKGQQKPQYLFEQQELISKNSFIQEEDELFYEACEFVIDQGGASSSSLQRRFRIGYNRAARLIEMMQEQGIVSEQKGSKPRDVLITEDQLVEINEQNKMN